MHRETTIARIKEALGERLLRVHEKSPKRVYIEIAPKDVPDATRFMFEDLQARFQIATGLDTPTGIEVLYHWALDRLGCVITVRTRLDREDPEIESIAPILPAAEWIEREMWELLGIRFQNHPDLRHLLLDDAWPEHNYPLRRDYEKR